MLESCDGAKDRGQNLRIYDRRDACLAGEETEMSGPAMVLVAVAKSVKSSRVMPDDHRVHTLGHRDLPGVVLSHALGRTPLAERGTLGVLTADGLPAESS